MHWNDCLLIVSSLIMQFSQVSVIFLFFFFQLILFFPQSLCFLFQKLRSDAKVIIYLFQECIHIFHVLMFLLGQFRFSRRSIFQQLCSIRNDTVDLHEITFWCLRMYICSIDSFCLVSSNSISSCWSNRCHSSALSFASSSNCLLNSPRDYKSSASVNRVYA